jgi:hypothetical protein
MQGHIHNKVCIASCAITPYHTDTCCRAMADPDMGVDPVSDCQNCQNCLRPADRGIFQAAINLITWQIYKVLDHLTQQGHRQTVKQLAALIRKLNKGSEDHLLDRLHRGSLGTEAEQLLLHESVSVANNCAAEANAIQTYSRDWKSLL